MKLDFRIIYKKKSLFIGKIRSFDFGRTVTPDDIFQLAIERILKYKDKEFESLNKMLSLFSKIIVNLAHDAFRKKKEKRSFEDLDQIEKAIASDSIADFDNRELLSVIYEILNNIESSKRPELLMKYLEGYKYEELAQMYGLPMGTVKNKIFDLRKLISNTTNGNAPSVSIDVRIAARAERVLHIETGHLGQYESWFIDCIRNQLDYSDIFVLDESASKPKNASDYSDLLGNILKKYATFLKRVEKPKKEPVVAKVSFRKSKYLELLSVYDDILTEEERAMLNFLISGYTYAEIVEKTGKGTIDSYKNRMSDLPRILAKRRVKPQKVVKEKLPDKREAGRERKKEALALLDLGKLSEKQRICVTLYLEGQTSVEIALARNISVEDVRTILNSALKRK